MVVGLGLALSLAAESLRWMMLVAFAAGLSVVFVPHALGYCPSSQMPCNYGTVPMLRFLGGMTVLVAIVGIVLSRRGTSGSAGARRTPRFNLP